MTKKILLLVAAAAIALCALAQNRFYVVMKDGTADGYPSEKVDSLSFDAPNGFKVMGFGDLMDAVSAMRATVDSIASASSDREKELNTKIETISSNATANEKALKNQIDSISKVATTNEKALTAKIDSINKMASANEKTLNTKIDSINKVADAKIDSINKVANANEKALNTKIDSISKSAAANEKVMIFKIDSLGDEIMASRAKEAATANSLDSLAKTSLANEASLKSQIDSLANELAIVEKYELGILKKYGIEALKNNDDKLVDLGLPSGTLWAAYNVGANKPEEYGDHFAWGETETKETYTEDNSQWYGKSTEELRAAGVIDENSNLTAEYDAATAKWGEEWKMPTVDEIEELAKLQNEYAEVNGVGGRRYIGTNGNTLFFPFAGYHENTLFISERGGHWSATEGATVERTYGLCVYQEKAGMGTYSRYYGFSVRPVLRSK